MKTTIELGSISSVRTQDLLDAFRDECHRLGLLNAQGDAAVDLAIKGLCDEKPTAEALDYADAVLAELTDKLESAAPEGTYFGAHWGDGSDFGFWPEEILE